MSGPLAGDLVRAVEARVHKDGCDHSHRATFEWAEQHGIGHDDLLDLLEAHGCFCDCEVLSNLPEVGDVAMPPDAQQKDSSNPWQLPPDYRVSDPTKTFTKQIVSEPEDLRNCYAPKGDVLVPPPFGAKARKRVRKSVHFFVGLNSGLPNELGLIESTTPTTAAQFAKAVRASGHPELSIFRAKEAFFVLSKLERLSEGTPVATNFLDVTGMSGKRWELRVHKVIMRK